MARLSLSIADVAVLVAAAGGGSRLGRGPKANVTLRGRTLLDLALAALQGSVEEVVVALPASDVTAARATYGAITVLAGGATRQESVERMLAEARSSVVLVHDVARPYLTRPVVERVAAAARASGAATAALDVADTVYDVRRSSTLDRADLRMIQTPQGFQRELLIEAHAAALRDGVAATDDAELVRRLGHAVTLVQGSRLLHKITSHEDLIVADALYDVWRREAETGTHER